MLAITESHTSTVRQNPKSRLVALPDISNNVGPVKLFFNTLLSFHLKEFFSFVLFGFLFFLHRRPRLVRNLSIDFSPT